MLVAEMTEKTRRASAWSIGSTWKMWSTMNGVKVRTVTNPTNPSTKVAASAVYMILRVRSSAPFPSVSATYLTVARPKPKSTRLR